MLFPLPAFELPAVHAALSGDGIEGVRRSHPMQPVHACETPGVLGTGSDGDVPHMTIRSGVL